MKSEKLILQAKLKARLGFRRPKEPQPADKDIYHSDELKTKNRSDHVVICGRSFVFF